MKTAALLFLAGLAACGYRPTAQTDTAAPGYQADLATCRDTAASDVNKRNAKTGLAWLASPVRRWGQIGDATGACMEAKGYGQVRWCTADELRTGGGNQVVTSTGVQCSDPPRRRPT